MNKCPKCQEYSMDYDIFTGRAICTHNGCGFKKRINEDKYIDCYADKTKSVKTPLAMKQKQKTLHK